MKRLLKIVGLAVAALVAVIVVIGAMTFLGRQSITDGFETNGIHIIKDGIVSVGLFAAGPGQVALVDAGNDQEAKAILAELSRRQLGADAVSAILITHGHADHTGGIRMFPKARVMALEREVALVEGREGAHGPVTQLMPVRPTGVTVTWPVRDGEMAMVGDTPVRVFAVPGHTAGSAAYLINSVLFLGDAADTTDAGEIKGAPWVFSDSQSEDRASLVRLGERLQQEHLDVRAMAFAHSGVRTDGLAPLLAFAGQK